MRVYGYRHGYSFAPCLLWASFQLSSIEFLGLSNLAWVASYIFGIPVSWKLTWSKIIDATPFADKKICGIPCPLKPASMN